PSAASTHAMYAARTGDTPSMAVGCSQEALPPEPSSPPPEDEEPSSTRQATEASETATGRTSERIFFSITSPCDPQSRAATPEARARLRGTGSALRLLLDDADFDAAVLDVAQTQRNESLNQALCADLAEY